MRIVTQDLSPMIGDLLHQEWVLGSRVLTAPQSTGPTNDLSDASGDDRWE